MVYAPFFQPPLETSASLDTFISATDLPLLLGVDALSRSWGASVLSRFWVGFRSLFVIIDRN